MGKINDFRLAKAKITYNSQNFKERPAMQQRSFFFFMVAANIEICATTTQKVHKWNVCAIEFRDDGNSAEPIPQGRLLLYAHGTCDLILLGFVKIPRSPLNLMYKILDTSTREKRGSAKRHKKARKTMFKQPAATYIIFLFFFIFSFEK